MKTFEITDALCARLGVSPVSALSPNSTANAMQPVAIARSPSGYDPTLADRDPLFQAMARLGLVIGGPRRTDMGWTFDLICPWVHEHTLRATTGTAYAPGVERFKCQHGHCIDRTPGDLKPRLDEMLRADSHGLVGLAQIAGEVEFDVVDPATVPLPDFLLAPETAVQQFYARYVYLRPRNEFWDLHKRVLVGDRDLDTAWTRKLGAQLPVTGTGQRRRLMSPARWFLQNARGRRVEGLVYWPDQLEVVQRDGQALANLWAPRERPLRAELISNATVKPWLDLFWHVMGGDTLETADLGRLVLDWLAMVVASNVKGGWQVLVIGKQGIGKDMILEPVMQALDTRAQAVTGDDLNGAFTGWQDKRLVRLAEIRQTSWKTITPRDQMTKLKGAFDPGKGWLSINPKMAPQYEARNVLMGWLTSNEDNPLRLEDGDRRFLVLDRRCADRQPDAFYQRVGTWYRDARGEALVAEWLSRRWDVMPEHRRRALVGVAPMTEAKAAIIAENEDPVDAWLKDVSEREHPDPYALPDVVSVDFVVERLLQAQKEGRFGSARVNPNAASVGRRLAKIGATQLNGGAQVYVEGHRKKVWAVRNAIFYSPLNPADIAKICNTIGLGPQSAKSH
jgi:hypothetical protein